MDHTEAGFVGLERSLMVKTKTLDRLIKEHREAKKKMNEVDDAKKTFLKIQIPKMEKEIKSLKEEIEELLEEDELDPRGEYFVLATQLCN
ncbi:hypothetical protein FRACYDRAFT_275181 [Fragilariopsis cylindrus CCMP1102]|uniref:Tubulin-specific chaperone A n=1 Tax=Fragilariopsis cylindrus CCMP1102 TaxID=635003 RepID=A0A1E7FHT3_9STRA|nr:hypothetical protein FRACYDRAFT_275181 [Fragilariopsis cylindrus CCMP1102]|eukprot:OEU17732.1 hypothetical protein FRACYDRAFT_275181 [Fragilariopsis cylindrus CCMP1102]